MPTDIRGAGAEMMSLPSAGHLCGGGPEEEAGDPAAQPPGAEDADLRMLAGRRRPAPDLPGSVPIATGTAHSYRQLKHGGKPL